MSRLAAAFSRWGLTLTTVIPLVFLNCVVLQAQEVRTIAGGKPFVFSGIGGAATAAPLGYVSSVAVDAQGNVYALSVSESNIYALGATNNIVVKVNSSGVLSVVAGTTGRATGTNGDGGPATSASFEGPVAIAVDNTGNLFILDSLACTVRKVNTSGIISTFAGSNGCGYSGDGGPAASAQLNSPTGMSVDANGNLYIADLLSDRIRKVTPTGLITTVAGSGAPGQVIVDGIQATESIIIGPGSVVVDRNGVMYIAETFAARIRRVGTDGIITTIGGGNGAGFSGDGGPATAAQINYPLGLALDNAGGIQWADGGASGPGSRVRRIAPDGTIHTIAGTGVAGFSGDGGPATLASIEPAGVAADAAGNLYMADSGNLRVREINAQGVISTFAGDGNFGFSGDGGAATSATLNNPSDVLVDKASNLYISDTGNNRIRKVDASGMITTIAGINAAGFAGDGGLATQARLNQPEGLAMDGAGNLYIADVGNARVRKVDANGVISTVVTAGTPTSDGNMIRSIADVAIDAGGNLYVLDYGGVYLISPSGTITALAPSVVNATSADFLAVNSTGEVYVSPRNFLIYVQGASLIRPSNLVSISPGGQTASFASGFSNPGKIAFDGQGNLYVPDINLGEVVELSPSGTQLKVFTGFYLPTGAAFDSQGNLYVADRGNNRIQMIYLGSPVQRGPIRFGPALR